MLGAVCCDWRICVVPAPSLCARLPVLRVSLHPKTSLMSVCRGCGCAWTGKKRRHFPQEGKGEEFLAEAEKELRRFAPFAGSTKKENAAALLTKAGNAFKATKRCASQVRCAGGMSFPPQWIRAVGGLRYFAVSDDAHAFMSVWGSCSTHALFFRGRGWEEEASRRDQCHFFVSVACTVTGRRL